MTSIKELILEENIVSYLETNDRRYSLLTNANDKTFLYDNEKMIIFDEISNYVYQNPNLLKDEEIFNANKSLFYIINSTILVVLTSEIISDYQELNISQYDLSNKLAIMKKINFQFMNCSNNCNNHDLSSKNCKKDSICIDKPSLYIYKLRKQYEYLITYNHINRSKSTKSIIINIETMENIIFDNYYLHDKLISFLKTDFVCLFAPGNLFLIYNPLTLEKKIYENINKFIILADDKQNKIIKIMDKSGNQKLINLMYPVKQHNKMKFNIILYEDDIVIEANDDYLEYEYIINLFTPHKFIESREMLYEIIKDAFDNKSKNVTFCYEINKEDLKLTINIDLIYLKDQLIYILKRKPIDKLQMLENKVNSINNTISKILNVPVINCKVGNQW